jgi:charged multivesicular body protein 5
MGKEEKEEGPKITLDDSIKMIDDRSAHLDKKIKDLDIEIHKQKEIINKSRNVSAKNAAKQRAIQLLKQKKTYENQRNSLMQQSFNIEQASFATQTMQDTALTIQAMRGANMAMKNQMKELNLDDLEDIQDELQDMFDQTNEIQEIMSRSYDMPGDINEADLEQELQDFELDMSGEELPDYLTDDIPTNLPSIPTTAPTLGQPQLGAKIGTGQNV